MTRQEFTSKTRIAAMNRAEWQCQGKGCSVNFRSTRAKGKPQFDHIQPCCDGGDNSLDNCQVLCTPCHNKKTGKDVNGLRHSQRLERKEAGIDRVKVKIPSRRFNPAFKPNTRDVNDDLRGVGL